MESSRKCVQIQNKGKENVSRGGQEEVTNVRVLMGYVDGAWCWYVL